MVWKVKMTPLTKSEDIIRPFSPRLVGFFSTFGEGCCEKRSAEPVLPCKVMCSCQAPSAVLCAVKAALTPDANHTPPVDLQDYRTGKKMKVKHGAQ